MWVIWMCFQQLGVGDEPSRTVALFKDFDWLWEIEASKHVEAEYAG